MTCWLLAGMALLVGLWVGWTACYAARSEELKRAAAQLDGRPPFVFHIDAAFLTLALRQLGADVRWPGGAEPVPPGERVH